VAKFESTIGNISMDESLKIGNLTGRLSNLQMDAKNLKPLFKKQKVNFNNTT